MIVKMCLATILQQVLFREELLSVKALCREYCITQLSEQKRVPFDIYSSETNEEDKVGASDIQFRQTMRGGMGTNHESNIRYSGINRINYQLNRSQYLPCA